MCICVSKCNICNNQVMLVIKKNKNNHQTDEKWNKNSQ